MHLEIPLTDRDAPSTSARAWRLWVIVTCVAIGLIVAWREFRQVDVPTWPASCVEFEIEPDGQRCIGAQAKVANRPLLVSLHTWSGDYRQFDSLAAWAIRNDWNYIHPDFQGPNVSERACLSGEVIRDIDQAIDWAIERWGADRDRIQVVGESGGGHAALGYWIAGKHPIASTQAWCAMTDLIAWHAECAASDIPKFRQHADDIMRCTGSVASLNQEQAALRSPLHMPLPERARGALSIFAGITDGQPNADPRGPVPVSPSIRFFNRVAAVHGTPGIEDALAMTFQHANFPWPKSTEMFGGRRVALRRQSKNVTVVLFDGGHERLDGVVVELLSQAGTSPR